MNKENVVGLQQQYDKLKEVDLMIQSLLPMQNQLQVPLQPLMEENLVNMQGSK